MDDDTTRSSLAAAVADGVSSDADGAAADEQSAASDTDADTDWLRLRALVRLVAVVREFLPLALTYLRDRRRFLLFGRRRQVTADQQTARAERLLDSLVALGPTFIKLGQILSTRPDALPRTYIDVLSRLQDRVPADDWDEVRPVVESDLGPVDEVFDDFDTEPISGASLGQVYTARVDGQQVAVKVLRPDIRPRVEADLRVIDALMPLLTATAPQGQAYTLQNLGREFADAIREEMDYAHEAAMLRTIRDNFADDESIIVPEVLVDHSSPRVLTMEYVDGIKIDDVDALDEAGIDRTALIRRLESAYIQMILEDGVFHADPHPGNLAVKRDGSIVFYDFGMTGRVSQELQNNILDFYVAIARDDIDGVIDAFVAMDALDPTADRELMREVFDLAIESFRGNDLDDYRIEQLVGEFQSNIYEFPLRLPQQVALIVRVTTVLDGVAGTLDPEFDVIALITDYVREEGYGEEGVKRVVESTQKEIQATAQSLVRVPPKLERVLDRAERGNLALGIVLAGGREEPWDRFAKRLCLGILLAASVAATLLLVATTTGPVPLVAAAGTAVLCLLFAQSLRGKRGLRVSPQFTRQEMRQRRRE
ncbi:Predicted unusual protein kinase regulating ubiquinone biosynthesis, AarF/ABC1/UbiB family [Halogranum gelatinilyticum]|uniref:Predicted unusual protein kinase regulating ubiquinone biosynthesis, AarF/ABC1/UbiB family n=1 Tax=Halogranum gelatinilyticum TaxID=660521 RepID=A0A1G9XGF8_9EURY|nr:AarF/ABC1/UbiB kinase family protein [Halogranum gelatinilyticum]SDM95800.1 Predicted unusual protein kinase regulating ubiquinone biosynthesis, AarF/ABC1/UbiB family [Halogranum gelatinilyticum]